MAFVKRKNAFVLVNKGDAVGFTGFYQSAIFGTRRFKNES
jgi:hypothetical protein